ncbi:MAG: sigma-70 family RNA polymerase sigma factor [Kofleriaceae bacterium]|nr:sigma-70 family RNA polymerase sigma factor [Kofleriaceae bacterium]
MRTVIAASVYGGSVVIVPEHARKSPVAKIPLRRLGEPHEIDAAIRFILECDYFTGECIALPTAVPIDTSARASYCERVGGYRTRSAGSPARVSQEDLAHALDAARAAWPDVELSPDQFAAWLGERLEPGEPLSKLRTSELYLVCACAAGDVRALRYFDEHIFNEVDQGLLRVGISRDAVDDYKQDLREYLLLGHGGAAGRIATYSGTGPLRNWVRVVAVRAALRRARQAKSHTQLDSSLLGAVAAEALDVEREYLKRRYGAAFEDALRAAFSELPPRTQTILRFYYGERLTIDKLGAMYCVHRVTASRWVRQAMEQLVEHTRLLMKRDLAATDSEITSLLRLVASRIEPVLQSLIRHADG